jgi:hypothetical protein
MVDADVEILKRAGEHWIDRPNLPDWQ